MSALRATEDALPGHGLRPLGRAGLRVGPMAFGAAVIGNLYSAIDDDTAATTVAAALKTGVRYIDTAPHYGLGLSERRLGAALRDWPRNELIVSTKVGRVLVANAEPGNGGVWPPDDEGFDVPASLRRIRDYSRDGVLRSLESSLTRLGVDHVDIVFVHDPDDHYRQALDGAFPALEDLRAQGVIRSYGAGMNVSGMLADFVRHTNLDVVMLAGRYTLLDQSAVDDLLPRCVERGVSVVAAGVFNSGILATERPRPGANYNYTAAPEHLVLRAQRIADICDRHGVTLPMVAAQFPLAHPAIATVCLGARTAAQVTRNAALFERPVPPDVWRELVAVGLLRDDVPVGTRP